MGEQTPAQRRPELLAPNVTQMTKAVYRCCSPLVKEFIGKILSQPRVTQFVSDFKY